MKPRPTDVEFEELKRKRDEGIERVIQAVCDEQGWPRSEVNAHASHSHGCYCACPDGPCQHIWDGDQYVSEDECLMSTTCSLCGAIAAYHDMRCGP